MKKIFIVLCIVLTASIGIVQGQGRTRRDSIGVTAWKRAVMKAPVLTGETAPRIIVPHEQPLCFHTEFDLKMTVGSKLVEQCMFINQDIGIIGYLPPSTDGLQNMLFPELVDFSFFIMGLKGNVYHYFNRKAKGSTIDHWVSTGNTEAHQYRQIGTSFTGSVDLSRKNVTGSYCGGTLTAMAYRFSTDANMTWYLYGDRFPEKLHPQKFLGNFGVGYLLCTEGLYAITEFQSPGYTCRVSDIQVTNTCLNTAIFKIMEDEYVAKRTADLQKEKEKLERQAESVTGDCAAERTSLLNFRREVNRRQEEATRRIKDGNTYQDAATQKNMLSSMDPLTMVQENILSTQVSICQASKRAERGGSGASASIAKVNCLTNQLSVLQQLEIRMKALDVQYASEPGRAFAEKSRLYMQGQPPACR
ncbi:MAG: hypothetical protein QM731_24405 [Chitinophagaceae bacterium]